MRIPVTWANAHKRFLAATEEMKREVTTPEGIRYALTSLREQASQIPQDDWTTKQVVDETIKYFEEKLRAS